ncbi:caspase-3-like [Patiria miniata]|uniref:Caspase-3 n=1 Tax=Patiria miniata TaxID=46514 RepID=A0A913Z2F3_PATMI|nr:caspase-3-like [Patiria miniata]
MKRTLSGHCVKGQTDDDKTKMQQGATAPSGPAGSQQQGAHIESIRNVSGSFNPISVGSKVAFTVNEAAAPSERAGTVSQEPQSGNPTAGTASPNPLSGNPTADSQQQGAYIGSIDRVDGSYNPISVGSQVTLTINKAAAPPERAGALNAAQIADDLSAVEPDSKGSYAAHKMKTSGPTPDMLDPKLTYEVKSKCKGLAFILNNIDFNRNSRREGSQIDTANMEHLFKELGYTPSCHKNLKGEDITKFFKDFASEFNHTHDSAVIALMSHGDTGVIYGTDDVQVKLGDLQRELEPHKCPGLDGKPKMFFVQACRGKFVTTLPVSHDGPNTASGAQESNQLEELVPVQLDTFIADIGNPADVHFAYATTDGYLSLRNTVSGSFFVQALCEIFFDRAHLDNLDTLMNKVRNCALEWMHDEEWDSGRDGDRDATALLSRVSSGPVARMAPQV